MKRKRTKSQEPPAGIPDTPRPVPDVEIPPLEPDLWADEGGGGAYPAGPAGKPKKAKKG